MWYFIQVNLPFEFMLRYKNNLEPLCKPMSKSEENLPTFPSSVDELKQSNQLFLTCNAPIFPEDIVQADNI